jgi:multidrug efflux pump subunit AcrA (membrane-fusion protein)
MKRALLLLAACHGATVEHTPPAQVRVETAKRASVVDRVLLTGELRAANAVDLQVPRTEAWQQVIKWMAEDGAAVKAGDRVLEFDTASVAKKMEDKKLALVDAEMTLESARALASIEAETKQVELEQHKIALEKATAHADVPADLLSVREGQERQLDKKRMQVAVDKAALDLAAQQQQTELDLRVKQIDVDKAKRAIESTEKSIADLVMAAPRDGVIVVDEHPWEGRKFHVGDTVWPGMRIVSLPDPAGGMEVSAELSDVDDGRVHVDDKATCTLDAYPNDPIACTVLRVTPVASSKNGRASLRRAFEVVLTIPKGVKDSERMRSGMSVKVEIARTLAENVMTISRGSPQADASKCDAQKCAVKP